VSVRLTTCDVLDFADELRELQSRARAMLGGEKRPKKSALSAYVAEQLTTSLGEHRAGYAAAPTAFGGQRWHYRCPGCEGRVQRLYKESGTDGWGCRWCAGVGRIRRDRGTRWAELLWPLLGELERYERRPGRRPRRYHRALRRAAGLFKDVADALTEPRTVASEAPTGTAFESGPRRRVSAKR
jgi:hypothetical protein